MNILGRRRGGLRNNPSEWMFHFGFGLSSVQCYSLIFLIFIILLCFQPPFFVVELRNIFMKCQCYLSLFQKFEILKELCSLSQQYENESTWGGKSTIGILNIGHTSNKTSESHCLHVCLHEKHMQRSKQSEVNQKAG